MYIRIVLCSLEWPLIEKILLGSINRKCDDIHNPPFTSTLSCLSYSGGPDLELRGRGGGVVVSRPWAKGVARFLFFCLPCRLFFLVRFFFTQNKKGGGGRARALRPPSPGSATVLYWLSARERYVILGKLSQSHLILRPENSGFIVMTWCTYANILIFKEV